MPFNSIIKLQNFGRIRPCGQYTSLSQVIFSLDVILHNLIVHNAEYIAWLKYFFAF